MDRQALTRLNRRHLIQATACGFGGLAAKALASEAVGTQSGDEHSSKLGEIGNHFPPKAKRVIFLFMQGGVSQVDSFDYKPELAKRDGQKLNFNDSRTFAKTGMRASQHRLMQSPWQFRKYGESSRWVSDLFPETAKHVDDLCFLYGMHTDGIAHGPATLFLHCGSTNFVRPSVGSWIHYALGTENSNLPGFVSIAPSIGNGGPRNYGSAFLPAKYQGTRIGTANSEVLDIDSLQHPSLSIEHQQQQMTLLQRLNAQQQLQRGLQHSELDAVIESYELAWSMQTVAPEHFDLETESAETKQAYGLNSPETRGYGTKCLLARRLCEAGVRFIQVNYGDNSANPAWDQHSNLPKHAKHAKAVDQPISALLHDLKQRGLLDDTIVWWGGEFGRTPYSQNNGTGRDHNPNGFTVWLAGGGFKPGYAHGETDEFGFAGVQGKVHMHDLHATLLHQLGLDHERLTFRHAGRDFRLTDVYGRVVKDILT